MERASLSLLIEITSAARDNAARSLGARRAAAQRAQQQLQTLRDYARDYAHQMRPQAQHQLDPAAQHSRRAFMARLEDAIQTQQREVDACEEQVRRAVLALTEEAARTNKMQALATRHDQQVLIRAERRDQKETDEIAQRQAPVLTAAHTSERGGEQSGATARPAH